ncbi:MAG: amino acid ABC transporter permease [Clostridiales Family XIII bacterium]|jgi:polar amino acid transport system permease protein|nr:amino acid ABC transporter permease [Clostridiales Family XIII bacterium]
MFEEITIELFKGLLTTFELFIITLVIALPLGLVITFCSLSKVRLVSWLAKTFVWIIRGTPLMLQILAITFIPMIFNIKNLEIANFLGVKVSDLNFIYVVIAFIINYAAYFSEIYRGGILAISKGQYEAGQVLGMNRIQIFFNVIFLQVVKKIITPMSNEIITLVKDTALARVVGVVEIIMVAEDSVNKLVAVWPIFYSSIFYLVFVALLTVIFNLLEKKLSYFN